MDPSKRVCLKNLPRDCTKREIAELVRNRTGAQPHSIDLGLSDDGKPRPYAHFSCEGAKHVIEVLGAGVMLRESVVQAFPAHPHYSCRYAEARRKRERLEESDVSARELYWEKVRERLARRQARPGELPTRPPRHFDATRRCYARVAAEIARASREAHRSRTKNCTSNYSYSKAARVEGAGLAHASRAPISDLRVRAASSLTAHESTTDATVDRHTANNSNDGRDDYVGKYETCSSASGAAASSTQCSAHAGTEKNAIVAAGGRQAAMKKKNMSARWMEAAAAAPTPVVTVAPTSSPVMSKEERKLSGLQSKLAALKARLIK